jgi:surface carbohydrate biosynthesis protein
MRKLKVCLIIDNPLRDLDSMILLASHLVNKNIDVFLTSMYNQESQVAEICPDYILVNYVRPNNKIFLEKLEKCGITIGALDTEGGAVIMDLEESLIHMLKNGAYNSVNDYFLWGNVQYDAILKSGIVPSEKLHVTGTPRYDFCCLPWINIYDHPYNGKNYFLVNTNFPLLFPKFQTFAQEIETFYTLSNFSIEEIIKITNEFFSNWSKIIESIISISKLNKINIVIRPHPFEDELVYKKIFKNFDNVEVIKVGSAIPWIFHSNALIHRDCSTALEASFMNINPISIEYPKSSSNYRQEVPQKVSVKANNLEELNEIVQKLLLNKENRENSDTNNWVISNWYRAIDGKSALLISEIISKKINYNSKSFISIFNIILNTNKSKIKYLLQKLNLFKYNKIKKEIDFKSVSNIIDKLNSLNEKKISCSKYFLNKSIRIFEKP